MIVDDIRHRIDVQSQKDERNIVINKVGIKGLKWPLVFENCGNIQHTVAELMLTVELDAAHKGTHMSRFVERWQSQQSPFTLEHLKPFLEDLSAHLHARAAYCVLEFPLFYKRVAPVSRAESLADFVCQIHGALVDNELTCTLVLKAPATSLCPCSREISKYGAHSQRSILSVTLTFNNKVQLADFNIDQFLISMERVASSQLYPLLKRPDEKFVTESAYENPRFVEDLVRELACLLLSRTDLSCFQVESENYESIHNHQAYAKVEHRF